MSSKTIMMLAFGMISSVSTSPGPKQAILKLATCDAGIVVEETNSLRAMGGRTVTSDRPSRVILFSTTLAYGMEFGITSAKVTALWHS